jgi:VanZ family protein
MRAPPRFSPAWLAAYALPPVAWAGVIFWLSSRTATEAERHLGPLADIPLFSEAFHFGEYLVLALLVFRLLAAIRSRAPAARGRVDLGDFGTANLAGAIAFAYALSDEYHQTFVPGRTFSVADLAVDLAGVVTGVAVAWGWRLVRASP